MLRKYPVMIYGKPHNVVVYNHWGLINVDIYKGRFCFFEKYSCCYDPDKWTYTEAAKDCVRDYIAELCKKEYEKEKHKRDIAEFAEWDRTYNCNKERRM